MCTERINQLIQNFNDHLANFIQVNPYSGPSLYFHERVIAMRRAFPLDRLLQSDWFLEYLYSLLASWGMHRMDGGARLKDFHEFVTSVRNIGNRTLQLQFVHLGEHQPEQIDLLCEVLQQETIMATEARLVGNSKLYHHLYPDLVPPIDRRNTLWFFENPQGDESDVFRFIMDKYTRIHNGINWQDIHYNGPMNVSRPKIIDNAIISYRIINGANGA